MSEIFLYKKEKKSKDVIYAAMAYPADYLYGMSVIGFLSMFKSFDENKDVIAQRIFMDSDENQINAKDMDVIGFSYIFDLDILSILKILQKNKIKIHASERDKNSPLIFAGGPVIINNPEPFADFFDFLIIGDGEGFAGEFVDVYKMNKNKTRKELLEAVSKIDGVYVPSLYKAKYDGEKQTFFYPEKTEMPRYVSKRISLSSYPLYSPIISDKTFYKNTAFVEIGRGCPYGCKFCAAHSQNVPVRYFDVSEIKKAIKKVAKYADKIILIGAMITMHPKFDEICIYLKKLKEKRNFAVEFSGLGFDFLSKHIPSLLDDKTISLAVECGNEKLREKTGKILSDEKIYRAVDFYSELGIKKINLYFLIGLPGETISDIEMYIDFSVKLAQKYKEIKFCHIINTFIPKAATPYEREARATNAYLKSAIEKIKSSFKENKIMAYYPQLERDCMNALISLGDRRLGQYLEHIYKNDIQLPKMLREYKIFMKSNNNSAEKLPHYTKYLYTKKSKEQILPWEFIKYGGSLI